MTSRALWKELVPHSTPIIHEKVTEIDNYIWLSTGQIYGEKGMVPYNHKLNRRGNPVKYPSNITAGNHCCCTYQNKIYIVDGCDMTIKLFNPSNKAFTKVAAIPKLGILPSGVIIDDFIHILNGEANKKHIIYSIKHNNVQSINDPTTQHKTTGICILNYKKRIIKFGGKDRETSKLDDTFYISSVIKPYTFDNIT